jgi:hypothetical protein
MASVLRGGLRRRKNEARDGAYKPGLQFFADGASVSRVRFGAALIHGFTGLKMTTSGVDCDLSCHAAPE